LSDEFGESKHVVICGLENASDLAIFDFAKDNGLTIVTFDSDFVDISVVKGFPPKVIWLKTGNQTTIAIADILNSNALTISHFLHTEEAGVLEIMK
jgi:predicted nuclease of predicted toxin-antitoxin system